MVLSADDGAAENLEAETGVVAVGGGKKTIGRLDWLLPVMPQQRTRRAHEACGRLGVVLAISAPLS